MRFAVLGDLHYSDYSTPELEACRDRVFRAWFTQMATLKPDFVFAVGDITQWGKLTELAGLKAIVEETKIPFIAITGNHDCYTLNKPELAPFFLGGYSSASTEELYTQFDRGCTRFILLDTAKTKEAEDYGGWLTDAQGQWLREQIANYNEQSDFKQLMIFGHHPLAHTTSRSQELKMNMENSEIVFPIFQTLKRSAGYYFCGHNHQHSLVQQAPWCYVQTAAPWDCLSFRWVTIAGDSRAHSNQITIETIHFDWSQESLQQDWELAHHSIRHFTSKPWEYANHSGIATLAEEIAKMEG